MPIQINLLAEAQALEELRRRDPVKRAVLAGIVLVAAVLCWSSSLMLKTFVVNSNLNRLQLELNSRTNDYRQVLENKRKLAEDNLKLAALNRLATNRFLVGNFLDAFQQTTVPNVQLVHLRLDLNYNVTQETKADPKAEDGAAGKAASSVEKISFTLNGKDTSPVSGDAVNKFRETIASAPYFRQQLGSQNDIRLKSLGAPQTDPDGTAFVLFAFEANLPEKKR